MNAESQSPQIIQSVSNNSPAALGFMDDVSMDINEKTKSSENKNGTTEGLALEETADGHPKEEANTKLPSERNLISSARRHRISGFISLICGTEVSTKNFASLLTMFIENCQYSDEKEIMDKCNKDFEKKMRLKLQNNKKVCKLIKEYLLTTNSPSTLKNDSLNLNESLDSFEKFSLQGSQTELVISKRINFFIKCYDKKDKDLRKASLKIHFMIKALLTSYGIKNVDKVLKISFRSFLYYCDFEPDTCQCYFKKEKIDQNMTLLEIDRAFKEIIESKIFKVGEKKSPKKRKRLTSDFHNMSLDELKQKIDGGSK